MVGLGAVARSALVGRLVRLAAIAALAAGPTGLSSAGHAQAGLLSLWTITAAPTTLTQYQPTSVVLTVTALPLTTIGCVRVSIPAGFTVSSWSAPSPWTTQRVPPAPPTVVQFNVASPAEAIANGASVDLIIAATPTTTLLGSWSASSYSQTNCSNSSANGLAITLAAFLIVPARTPAPTPNPSPTPTLPAPTSTLPPAPTPSPTSIGVPIPTLVLPPIAEVTIPPVPSLLPGPSSTPTPVPTTPSGIYATATPSVAPVAIATTPSDGSGGSAPREPGDLTVAQPAPAGLIPVLDQSPFEVLGSFLWVVPGFVLGLPGLILLLVVAAQALGAGAFVRITWRTLRDPPPVRPARHGSGD